MWQNSLSFWFLNFTNFEYILIFFLIEFCKPCVIHGLVRNFSSFLLSFLSGAYISKRLSILDRYWFYEKLTSLFSVHRNCSQSVWLKSEINLSLWNFLQSSFNIYWILLLEFLRKNLLKNKLWKMSENVDVTLPDSISSRLSLRRCYQLL